MLTVSKQDDKYCEGFCDRTEKLVIFLMKLWKKPVKVFKKKIYNSNFFDESGKTDKTKTKESLNYVVIVDSYQRG